MRHGWQESLLLRLLLLFTLLWAWYPELVVSQNSVVSGEKKFGDRCSNDIECGFNGSFCDTTIGKCECIPELPVTNHIDKCGKPAKANESCFFNEQCEIVTQETECRDGQCQCRFEKLAEQDSHGNIHCVLVPYNKVTVERYIDPTMIGILVAMFLMFITICVVLRLFSRARWRENRTIFNTPNPRLMNVSLLRESKQERRGSKSSVKGPSRQPSMISLNKHSPILPGSLNASATSLKSNRSPPHHTNLSTATTPMLENVSVEVQEAKA